MRTAAKPVTPLSLPTALLLAGAALMAALVWGCSDAQEPFATDDPNRRAPAWPTQFVDTEHFRYYYRIGDEPCADALEQLETHYEYIGGYLGFRLPAGERIVYNKYLNFEDLYYNSPCGFVYACANSQVFSYSSNLNHELVHVYHHHLGKPPPIFVEGIANVASCLDHQFEPHDLVLADAPLPLKNDPYLLMEYKPGWDKAATGASLVRMLLDHAGPQAWRDFYRETPRYASEADLGHAFEKHFGLSMVQVVDLWRSRLPHPHWQSLICLDRCDGSEMLEVDGPALVAEGQLECAARYVPFEAEGDVVLHVRGNVDVELWPCLPRPGEYETVLHSRERAQPWKVFWLNLDPRRYFIKLQPSRPHSFDDDMIFDYSLEAHSPGTLVAERCSLTEPRLLDVEQPSLSIISSLARADDDHPDPAQAPDQPLHGVRYGTTMGGVEPERRARRGYYGGEFSEPSVSQVVASREKVRNACRMKINLARYRTQGPRIVLYRARLASNLA